MSLAAVDLQGKSMKIIDVAGNLYERNIAEVNRYDGYAAYGSAWRQHL